MQRIKKVIRKYNGKERDAFGRRHPSMQHSPTGFEQLIS
jgi:hypothetical protein